VRYEWNPPMPYLTPEPILASDQLIRTHSLRVHMHFHILRRERRSDGNRCEETKESSNGIPDCSPRILENFTPHLV